MHRGRKVLNIRGGGGGGGGKVPNIGGPRGAKLIDGCKLIGVPALQSVPNNYIFHIKNW